MIDTNSLGQKIKNPENFWKWFGDSITVDEQGRPRVFYHGTRQKFDTFKSEYKDNLIFFSYDEKFAQDWSRNAHIKDDQKQAYEEIKDKVYAYGKEIYKKFKEKYGENWLENEVLKDKYYQEKEEYKEQLLKEINLEKKVLGCYLKVSKLFIPERDSDLVLNEILKYYHWENKWDLDDKIKVAEDTFDKVDTEFDEWLKNNQNASEEEKKKQDRKLDDAYREMFSLKNEKAQFENDLKRIKQGAWIYFEHGNVIDKIYELGYDGIQLSESGGEQTTIAVRPNQIKSVNNKGIYNASENIYEKMNEESAWQLAIPNSGVSDKRLKYKNPINDNFWKWFGKSKVVDDNGEPLIVYHGSPAEFETFNLKLSSGMLFFTDSKENAEDYRTFNHHNNLDVYECYLKMENPKIIDMECRDWWGRDIMDIHDEYSINKGRKTNYVYLEAKKAKRQGYDGVIFKNIYDAPGMKINDILATDYVVFNANQVKSIYNDGSWSDSDNIYETLNEELKKYL